MKLAVFVGLCNYYHVPYKLRLEYSNIQILGGGRSASGSPSVDSNPDVAEYLFPTGFAHTSYVFNCESHVRREMPDFHTIPPSALIKLVAKGALYAEMDANLKEVVLKQHYYDLHLRILRTTSQWGISCAAGPQRCGR